ncbi:hypothetical protein GOP47_0001990 [Adiantum capillus-veneris]|uniref:non-specific serine/threonine protein kinase n=1 Tax=Adiantum capillus-veneris TaxID=13818 RepID=A0A9D4V9V3_ADICA|nr:hypothetical protein GOP47_0001990 [Adiantum capillus-veneris]
MKFAGFAVFVIVAALHINPSSSVTNEQDLAALQAIQQAWAPTSFSWSGDPCESLWLGVTCDPTSSNVIKLELPSQSIRGSLPLQIGDLTNLQTLDLSYNGNLTGTLPLELFQLANLEELFLQNCGLFGTIPNDLGKLAKLTYLALNQNFFTGPIPTTVGQLSEMFWFDLSYNQMSGNLPLQLANLTKARHFHLHVNNFSGIIPTGIFSAGQPLVHLLLYNNSFEGPVPSDIGNLTALDILRLDFNQFSSVPDSLTEMVTVTSLQLDHNSITGEVVNVSSLTRLQYLYLGHNQYTSGVLPSWLLSLVNLTTLDVENGGLQGPLPASLFALQNLEIVHLGYNHLNGTLDLSLASPVLVEVDMQQNNFTGLIGDFSGSLNLEGNDICSANANLPNNACGGGSASPNLAPEPSSSCGCSSGLSSNPTAGSSSCVCSYPVSGLLNFTALKVSLDANAISSMQSGYVESIPLLSSANQVSILVISSSTATLSIFPNNKPFWELSEANTITSLISSKSILFADVGPYIYIPSGPYFPPGPSTKSGLGVAAKAGIAVAAVVFFLLIIIVAVYALRQKKRAEKAEIISKPFASWVAKQEDQDAAPKLKGARFFTLAEMKKATNNFSQAQEIGAGGYGKVYKATLPSGEQVAIKRSQASSRQGAAEFKNEIELLSRLHHKNLVELVGFCFEEQMLIYEYLPNGTLREALSGSTNVVMDWPRRLQAAVDSARGLAYLHTEANPPIIHRDVKSSNILLDEKLVAKVADFGLSKLAPEEGGVGHVSTQVKGTLGYLDPEYYTTQRLSDKSDVYSFGVVILELITSRQPIEHGRFIVREVRSALQRGGLPALRESLVDLKIEKACPDSQLKPLLDLALRCVEESAALRPSMKQVTKELEAIVGEFEGGIEGARNDYIPNYKKEEPEVPLYDSSSFQYSGGISATVEPK